VKSSGTSLRRTVAAFEELRDHIHKVWGELVIRRCVDVSIEEKLKSDQCVKEYVMG